MQVHAAQEIPQGLEGPLLPRLDDGFHRVMPDPQDGPKPEANHVTDGGEALHRGVDVRRQDRDAALTHLAHVVPQDVLLGLHLARQVGRQELCLVVRLQVRRLVGHEGVGRAVGFVETISGKLLDQVEDARSRLLVDALLAGALSELGPLLLHDLDLLLPHGAAQQVRLAKGVPGQHGGGLHHLLLVEDDAVGVLQHVLQHGVWVLQLRLAVLALDVLIHHTAVEGPGAVHGQRRHQVVKTVDPELAKHPPDAIRFQLEDPHGVRLLEELVGGRVVHGEIQQVRRIFAVEPDVLHRLLEDGERLESQEVHLHQAQFLDGLHRELGHRLGDVQLSVRSRRGRGFDAANGHQVRDGNGSDDDTRRVLGGVARQPLNVFRRPQHVFDPRVLLRELRQLRRPLKGFVDALGVGGNQLCDPVHQSVLHPHGTPHILHRLPALHAAEGDDLGHPVAPIAFHDVLQELLAPAVRYVGVDIGHADALRVQKALKQQVILQGVQLRDAQAPGHEGPRR